MNTRAWISSVATIIALSPCLTVHAGEATSCAHPLFAGGQLSGIEPNDFYAIEDLDSDGDPDFVTVDRLPPTLTVALNQGDGTFGVDASYAVGDEPFVMTLGDLDNDGHLDIVVGSDAPQQLALFMGDGGGVFAPAVTIPLANFPRSITIGDVDCDGVEDLVVGTYQAVTFLVLLGNGDGTFAAPVSYGTSGGGFSVDVHIVDFDGQCPPDLIVDSDHPSLGRRILVYVGLGNGVFSELDVYFFDSFHDVDLGIADFNLDGIPDIVVSENSSAPAFDLTTFFTGAEDGSLTIVGDANVAGSVIVTEVNQDGVPDLVLNDQSTLHPSEIVLLLGDGDGAFTQQNHWSQSATVFVSDLDASGTADLLFARDDGSLWVSLSDGDGTFTFAGSNWIGPGLFEIDDFDRDGIPDLAINAADGMRTLAGHGDGTFFGTHESIQLTTDVSLLTASLSMIDVDGDDDDDIVAIGKVPSFFADSYVYVARAFAGGYFAPNAQWLDENVVSASIVDVNGDAAPDVLTGRTFADTIEVWLNDGTGTFAERLVTPSDDFVTVDVGHFNDDTFPDLAVVSDLTSSSIAIRMGNGDGTFQDPLIVDGVAPDALKVADVDGDGEADLLAGFFSTIRVYLGQSNAEFSSPAEFSGSGAQTFEVADLNDDGTPDVIMKSVAAGVDFRVYMGLGDGVLDDNVPYYLGGGVRQLSIGDVNGDTIPDIIAARDQAAVVEVLTGLGDGTFASPFQYVVHSADATAISDLNGDGFVDLLVGTGPQIVFVLSDCGCGNGTVEVGEDCDGSLCCTPTCRFKVSNTRCDNDDQNLDGIRDDPCAFWQCTGDMCVEVQTAYADLGGPFGTCFPDGIADGNDRFQALNCFANSAPDGGPYLCDDNAPNTARVDAGGVFGACCPDGVCDANDAFHALGAFAGENTCTCPASFNCTGPEPVAPPAHGIVDRTRVSLTTPQNTVQRGSTFEVIVTIDDGLRDLRGYQLHVSTAGGRMGFLELIDIAIEDHTHHVFAGLANWRAMNVDTAQVLAGLDTPGVTTPPGAYLATLTFRASPDALGTFAVDVLHDDDDPTHRTFLFSSDMDGRIAVLSSQPAIVDVLPNHKHKHTARR